MLIDSYSEEDVFTRIPAGAAQTDLVLNSLKRWIARMVGP